MYKTFQVPKDMEDKLKSIEPQAWDKIQDGLNRNRPNMICLPCFDDPNTTLEYCIRPPSFNTKDKKNGDYTFRTGNPNQHLKSMHPELWQQYLSNKRTFTYQFPGPIGLHPIPKENHSPLPPIDAYQLPTIPSPPVGASGLLFPASVPGASPVDTSQASLEDSKLSANVPGNVFIQKSVKNGDQHTLDEFHRLVVAYATNNNIAARTIWDEKNCPEFRQMMTYAIKHSGQLRRNCSSILLPLFDLVFLKPELTILPMQRAKFHSSVYAMITGIPSGRNLLGVSVVFYDPVWGCMVRVAIGLLQADGKTAAETTEQIIPIINACGIEREDLYKACNVGGIAVSS